MMTLVMITSSPPLTASVPTSGLSLKNPLIAPNLYVVIVTPLSAPATTTYFPKKQRHCRPPDGERFDRVTYSRPDEYSSWPTETERLPLSNTSGCLLEVRIRTHPDLSKTSSCSADSTNGISTPASPYRSGVARQTVDLGRSRRVQRSADRARPSPSRDRPLPGSHYRQPADIWTLHGYGGCHLGSSPVHQNCRRHAHQLV